MTSDSSSIPEWAIPLVERIRSAIIEKPGDVGCVSVLRVVFDELSHVDLPQKALDAGVECFYGQDHSEIFLSEIYHAINGVLAEELGSAS